MDPYLKEKISASLKEIRVSLEKIEEALSDSGGAGIPDEGSYSITTNEAARMLAIHPSALTRLAKRGLIPSVRRPGRGGGEKGIYLFCRRDLANAQKEIHELVRRVRRIEEAEKFGRDPGPKGPAWLMFRPKTRGYLSLADASRHYGLGVAELLRMVREGNLDHRVEEDGTIRRVVVSMSDLEGRGYSPL